LEVILVVIATPVKAAVATDNLRKDRLAILGLSVTLRSTESVPLADEDLILILAIDYSPCLVPFSRFSVKKTSNQKSVLKLGT